MYLHICISETIIKGKQEIHFNIERNKRGQLNEQMNEQ